MSACVLWTGSVDNRGYGRVSKGDYRLAHRAAYAAAHGSIPEGYVIHHECGVPLCVNPEHLTALTPGEHTRLHNPRPTHCVHGHAFTEANTYVYRRNGHRYCRRCKADREHVRRLRLADLVELAS